jgi:O6-methylguanine-DNA--protein-cysteine methyltransferase
MTKLPPTIKIAARKRAKPAPLADPLAKRAAKIQERMRLGEDVSPDEVRVLDAFLEGHGPSASQKAARAEPDPDDKSPPDVFARSQNHIAALLDLHKNTLTNWKAKGIEPIGAAPWSLKAFLLLLRRKAKLGECRATTPAVKELWKWAWGSAGEGSLNPDDPAHGKTENWSEERERQGALKEMTARKSLNMDLEKKAGNLKEDEAVRTMLRELRHIALGELSTVQQIANQVRNLTPTARADLADLLTAWQAQARKRIAESSDKLMAAKDPAHGIPG